MGEWGAWRSFVGQIEYVEDKEWLRFHHANHFSNFFRDRDPPIGRTPGRRVVAVIKPYSLHCPHSFYYGAICPHTLTPWLCSARKSRPCFESTCPYNLGEWGAWRSILFWFEYHAINIEAEYLCCDDECRGEPCPMDGGACDSPAVQYALNLAQESYDAVGWSP